MKTLLALLPGICSDQVDITWVDVLSARLATLQPKWLVVKKEYPAAAWSSTPLLGRMYTCYWRNKRVAKALTGELELYLKSPAPPVSIWYVAHSNGCNIARLSAEALIAKGYSLGGLILIGGACTPEVGKIQKWVDDDQLKQAVAVCSSQDGTLGLPFIWPYGRLGQLGWCRDGEWYGTFDIWSTFYNGYGHSDYFSKKNFPSTIDLIRQTIKNHTP